MKHCEKSAYCCYGNAYKEGYCAYKKNIEEWELCPLLTENWEETIDKLNDIIDEIHKRG